MGDPSSNHGLLVKQADEAGPGQRVLFLSDEAQEPQLRPNLVVVYTTPTADDTYYAPDTPSVRMLPGDETTVDVTLTNTTDQAWDAGTWALSYRWTLPDGTDKTTGGNQRQTALPADVAPGESVTVHAAVAAPINSDSGNKREQFVLHWDLRNTSSGAWLSQIAGAPAALAQNVTVEDPTSNQLGLESFYSYAGTATGAGSAAVVNTHAGNTVWSYSAFSHPGRGLGAFVRLSYNSLDTSDTAAGYGWSLAAAGLARLNQPLDFHPRGQDWPTTITLADGDGTSHTFELNKHGSTDSSQWDYDHPAGVHLYLQKATGDDPVAAWTMTRPDGVVFTFDAEGYLSQVADRNGNTQTFTYTQRKSNKQPRKFLAYVTDPTGRRVLSLDYYTKHDTNNPHIRDRVKSITDIAGRTLTFSYSDKGLLTKLVDAAGSGVAKTFTFGYDATQGNKNVKLVSVTDPRGHSTNLDYYTATQDPKHKWWLNTLTDRLNHATGFVYTDPDGTAGSEVDTTVTDAKGQQTSYHTDGYGRPTSTTNALDQTTKLGWDADNNVVTLTEDNGAVTQWRYDPATGYPTSIQDAQAVADATAPTTLHYTTSLGGHIARLTSKTTPEGRTWTLGYDSRGNLTSVTDPKGTATATDGDYQTTYTYDTHGQLTAATDANGNTTHYSGYTPVGYPATITDALGHVTTTSYDKRGHVTSVTDANGAKATYGYDIFGRPLQSKIPKDH